MNESKRTLVFVAVAVVSLFAAVLAAPRTKDPLQDVKLGEPFYPEFTDPAEAASLTVVVYNDETSRRQQFSVENDHGIWKIPSHNNYPADGEERLANTATSLIGVKRDGFQSRSANDHADLGVIDPLSDDTSKLKGRGDRLILKDSEGNTLVDFIVGKQVKGRDGHYYVRMADKDATYVAKLEVDLSTKFADWIETDLLKMKRDELNKITINNYTVDEENGTVSENKQSILTRDKSADPWVLAGLNAESEELETSVINSMISAMDNLKLIGVRPKPEVLKKDLEQGRDAVPKTQRDLLVKRQAYGDMMTRGFFLSEKGLLSNEGEVVATTNNGVEFVLRFGEIFTGTDLEIEAGIESDQKQDKAKKDEQAEGDKESDDSADKAGEGEEEQEAVQGRYLFAFARFDEAAIGPKPVEPQPPAETPADKQDDGEEKESGETPKEGEKKEADEKADDDSDTAPPADKEKQDAGKDDSDKADSDKQEEKPDPQAEYKKALDKYKTDIAAYEKKVADGKKEVEELNRRFADWYYVISEESFKKLRPARTEFVKEKEQEEQADKTDEGATTSDADDSANADEAPKPE